MSRAAPPKTEALDPAVGGEVLAGEAGADEVGAAGAVGVAGSGPLHAVASSTMATTSLMADS